MPLRGQLTIPDDTDVEMETIPGCTGTPAVVVIHPTTNGAQIAAPATVEKYEAEVEDDFLRVTLWVRRR